MSKRVRDVEALFQSKLVEALLVSVRHSRKRSYEGRLKPGLAEYLLPGGPVTAAAPVTVRAAWGRLCRIKQDYPQVVSVRACVGRIRALPQQLPTEVSAGDSRAVLRASASLLTLSPSSSSCSPPAGAAVAGRVAPPVQRQEARPGYLC